MKKFLGAIAIVLAGVCSVGATASAQTGYVYLGGAFDIAHCQQLAGAAGFRLATMGGTVNGIYYWNACFGSQPIGGGGDDGHTDRVLDFDVYVRAGHSDQQCLDDIEYELAGVRCRSEFRGVLNCRSYRGADERDLEYVRCVDEVYRL